MARRTSKAVGALWKHAPKEGQTNAYLTGIIDLGGLGEIPIAVFKNDRKEKENQPDYRIVLSQRRSAAGGEKADAAKEEL